jgi:outer membrane protein
VRTFPTLASLALLVGLQLSASSVLAETSRVRVGVVTDGPAERAAAIAKVLRSECRDLVEGEFEITETLIEADWTKEGVKAAIDRVLADPEVDVVLAMGVLASDDVARRRDLPKPVIAPYVVDALIQGIPLEGGASGVKNLSYVTHPPAFARDLQVFRELVPFERLVVLWGPIGSEASLVAAQNLRRIAEQEGVGLQEVTSTATAEATLAAIPADAEAVWVTPLLQLPATEMRSLAEGLIERGLPSFSAFGRSDVELGILASNAPETDLPRLARRVALNLHRILLGEEPGTLPVTFTRGEQLAINMATARAIGAYPPFALRTDADLLNEERQEVSRVLSLPGVLQEAVRTALDLEAAEHGVAAVRHEVRNARSRLLPEVNLSALQVFIDADRASPLQRERSLTGSLTFRQLLYSDRAFAGLSIQKQLLTAEERQLDTLRLDVALQAATAYLNVLTAKTFESIGKQNLRLTRSNLDRARVRVQIGMASRSELYRWESQIAGGRRDVIRAIAARNVAELEVNRLLDRPLEEPFNTSEVDLEDPSLITSDERMWFYFSNQWTFRILRAFHVQLAFDTSPELRQLEATIAAQERTLTAARRAFYLPDVALEAGLDHRLAETSGGGPAPFDDWDWQVGIQASIPLFTSGARAATRGRSSEELLQLQSQKRAVAQRIEQRVRAAMHLAGASNAGIGLAQAAAEAAGKNLDLVADAYSQGMVSIIELLDAQNASFVADLTAANALYDFLLDLMQVERAVGGFSCLGTPAERDSYFAALAAYFEEHGAHPARPEPLQ